MSTPFVGEIRLFGFPRVPVGWMACDGTLLPIAQYDALYSLIGTTYGGDGRVTFALPDLRGRLPVHQGTGPGLPNEILGSVGGSEAVTLNTAELPGHTHPLHATTSAASASVAGSAVQLGALASDVMYATEFQGATTFTMDPAAVSPTGGNQSHDNLMPTLTVSYCIAFNGIYPSQN